MPLSSYTYFVRINARRYGCRVHQTLTKYYQRATLRVYAARTASVKGLRSSLNMLSLEFFFFAFENKKNILQIIFNKHTHTFKAKNKINPKETEDTKVKCVYVCILCRVE